MAGRTAGPIMTKLGIGTHVDPGSVLGKVKVKVIWRYTWRMLIKLLTEARKGRDNSPQGQNNSGRRTGTYLVLSQLGGSVV